MKLLFSGNTDIGRVRKSNQDSICLAPEYNFYAVADGMGGHNGGDIASQMSVKILPEYLSQHLKDKEPRDTLWDSIRHVNRNIYDHAAKNEDLKGMGTTIVSAWVHKNKVLLGNVGDSRAYLVQKDKLFQLTKDHSLVQEKINMGLYTRDAAKKDPQKNVLVRTVGFEFEVDPDIYQYKYSPGDLLLLCSDGLHGKVSDHDILFLIQQTLPKSNITQENLDNLVTKLIAQANGNGGQDNISVILIKIL